MEEKQIDYKEIATRLDKFYTDRNLYGFYAQVRNFMHTVNKIQIGKRRENIQFSPVDYSIGQMQALALDFLGDVNPKFEQDVWDVLEAEGTTVLGKYSYGQAKGTITNYIPENYKYENKKDLKTEINLEVPKTAEGLGVVMHELGHPLYQRYQQGKNERSSLISEIGPLFLEKLYADWLFGNNIIGKTDRDNAFKARDNEMISTCETMLEEYAIFRLLTETSPDGKPVITERKLRGLREKLGGDWMYEAIMGRIDKIINKPNYSTGKRRFKYLLGSICASAMYEDYKKDPEKTIKRFQEFLDHSSEYALHKVAIIGEKGEVPRKADTKVAQQSLKQLTPTQTIPSAPKAQKRLVLDQEQVDKCFGTLLGKDYKQKLERAIDEFSKQPEGKVAQ